MLKFISDGHVIVIPQLSVSEAKRHKILGEAEGADDLHCLYLGMKHAKDFSRRVGGYRKASPRRKHTKVRIIFYVRRGPKDWSPHDDRPSSKS